jgi:hypothetical protein
VVVAQQSSSVRAQINFAGRHVWVEHPSGVFYKEAVTLIFKPGSDMSLGFDRRRIHRTELPLQTQRLLDNLGNIRFTNENDRIIDGKIFKLMFAPGSSISQAQELAMLLQEATNCALQEKRG